MTDKHFENIPSMLSGYKRALLQRPSKKDAPQTLIMRTMGAAINRINLTAFRKICGEPSVKHLPIAYLHILAAPLHIQLLTHQQFPYKAMGLVHVRNQITVHRHVHALELFDIEVSLGEQRTANKGTEFDILTNISVGDTLVWSEVTTVLAQKKSSGQKPSSKTHPTPHLSKDIDISAAWSLPSSLGVQYAKVCGDFNPIHLMPLSAKIFGFKRHIIHGMWTVGRLSSTLTDALPPTPFTQHVSFKRPVTLPQSVQMVSWKDGDVRHAQVFSSDKKTIFVAAKFEAHV